MSWAQLPCELKTMIIDGFLTSLTPEQQSNWIDYRASVDGYAVDIREHSQRALEEKTAAFESYKVVLKLPYISRDFGRDCLNSLSKLASQLKFDLHRIPEDMDADWTEYYEKSRIPESEQDAVPSQGPSTSGWDQVRRYKPNPAGQKNLGALDRYNKTLLDYKFHLWDCLNDAIIGIEKND